VYIRDKEGNVLTDSDKVQERWKEYIENLFLSAYPPPIACNAYINSQYFPSISAFFLFLLVNDQRFFSVNL